MELEEITYARQADRSVVRLELTRECATVIPYLNEPPCICSEQIDHVPKNELPKR